MSPPLIAVGAWLALGLIPAVRTGIYLHGELRYARDPVAWAIATACVLVALIGGLISLIFMLLEWTAGLEPARQVEDDVDPHVLYVETYGSGAGR